MIALAIAISLLAQRVSSNNYNKLDSVVAYHSTPYSFISSRLASTSTSTVGRMSSQEPTTPPLSVNDIAAMSDVALAEFMEKNRRLDGVFELSVADWDKISKEERKSLAERLMWASSDECAVFLVC